MLLEQGLEKRTAEFERIPVEIRVHCLQLENDPHFN